VKLIYPDSNSRFDMSVVSMVNYFLVGGDVLIDNDTFLVNNFVNLKIKLTQSFKDANRDMMYVRIFIMMSNRTCIKI
jgi:hypothetical protein